MARPQGLAKRQAMVSVADELSTKTHFSQDECIALLHTHENLVRRGKLDRGRFRQFFHACFEVTSDLMLDLLFRSFDRNGDGSVDAMEFVVGLSHMIRGNTEELTEFCYYVYDMNGDRSLAREELHQCLRGCFLPGYGLEPEDIEDAEKDIVEITLKKLDVNKDGQITYDDFQSAVLNDPLLVVACGECLPSDNCIARFLYTITDDYRSYSGPMISGGRRHTSLKKSQSRLPGARSSILGPN